MEVHRCLGWPKDLLCTVTDVTCNSRPAYLLRRATKGFGLDGGERICVTSCEYNSQRKMMTEKLKKYEASVLIGDPPLCRCGRAPRMLSKDGWGRKKRALVLYFECKICQNERRIAQKGGRVVS